MASILCRPQCVKIYNEFLPPFVTQNSVPEHYTRQGNIFMWILTSCFRSPHLFDVLMSKVRIIWSGWLITIIRICHFIWQNHLGYCDFILSYGFVAVIIFIWEPVFQRQVSRSGISNYISQILCDVLTFTCRPLQINMFVDICSFRELLWMMMRKSRSFIRFYSIEGNKNTIFHTLKFIIPIGHSGYSRDMIIIYVYGLEPHWT